MNFPIFLSEDEVKAGIGYLEMAREGRIPNLKRMLEEPQGWLENELGMLVPPPPPFEVPYEQQSVLDLGDKIVDRIEVKPMSGVGGFEIRSDGKVYMIEDGTKREATWQEALQIRAAARQAFGAVVHIEPE